MINIIGLFYNVTITDNYMTIGCESHPNEYWLSLKKEDIIKMDGKDALRFSKVWKKQLKKIIKERSKNS